MLIPEKMHPLQPSAVLTVVLQQEARPENVDRSGITGTYHLLGLPPYIWYLD